MVMMRAYEDICENYQFGEGTGEWRLDAGRCATMAGLGILWTGWSEAAAGYRFERQRPHFGGLLACYAGCGRVRLANDWAPCSAGSVYLMPKGVPHAYHADGAGTWGIVWTAFHEPLGQDPAIRAVAPKLISANPELLRGAVMGLYREWTSAADPFAVERWLWLVKHYATKLASGRRNDDRLCFLWAAVEARLAEPWNMETLSARAGLCAEQIRRLCRRELKVTPMQYVCHLRMQRAAGLLSSTSMKLPAIAQAVGYADAFAFSVAFARVIGVPPSHYRRRMVNPAGLADIAGPSQYGHD